MSYRAWLESSEPVPLVMYLGGTTQVSLLHGEEPDPDPDSGSVDLRVTAIRDSISNIPGASYWGQADPLYLIGNSPGMTTALRFNGVTIPQGATITMARVTVWSNLNQSNVADAWATLGAEQVDNASQITSGANHESRKTNLGTTVQWGPHAGLASANLPFQSPSLVSIVQQIVDRGGWDSGNSIQFFAVPNASTTVDYQFRSYWEGLSDYYPRFEASWTLP